MQTPSKCCMASAMTNNPQSLYRLSAEVIVNSVQCSGAIDDLHLPKTVRNDIKPLFVELPPGWYYSIEHCQFCIKPDECDWSLQREMCNYWMNENPQDYMFCIFTYGWTVRANDDHTVYVSRELIQTRLMSIFGVGRKNRFKPWLFRVPKYVEGGKYFKYLKVTQITDQMKLFPHGHLNVSQNQWIDERCYVAAYKDDPSDHRTLLNYKGLVSLNRTMIMIYFVF